MGKKLSLRAFAVVFVVLTIFNQWGINTYAFELPGQVSSEPALDDFRNIFYNDVQPYNQNQDFGIPSYDQSIVNEIIYVDDSSIEHRPQELPELSINNSPSTFSLTANSGPFTLGDERYFRVEVSDSPTKIYKAVKALLVIQAEHSNVWILDDNDFHGKTSTSHGNSCMLTSITDVTKQNIATTFDGIYDRMTDPETGFGTHEQKLFNLNYGGWTKSGDFGMDGKVNILLYDIDALNAKTGVYTAGFFWSYDMFDKVQLDGIDIDPIDMFHMDIGKAEGYENLQGYGDKLSFYGTLAHEFQHMLFNMYMGAYVLGSSSYKWYNEALSGLANVFYVQPGAEIINSLSFSSSARNSYTNGSSYGDFLNFNNSQKNYGMGYLHSIMMYKKTNGTYGRKMYDFFNTGSLSNNNFAIKNNYVASTGFDVILGGGFKATLGSLYDSFDNKQVFDNLYYIFMENFASDGGIVRSTSPLHTYKFSTDTSSSSNLWYTRQNGTDISQINSGSAVVLKGYTGSTPRGATHDKMYKIGSNTSHPLLRINIPDVPGMQYYVVIPNTSPAAGADVYPMQKGQDNDIDTFGRTAYLFVSTLFSNIDTTVTYSWNDLPSNILTGTVSINNTTPRIGDTLTGSYSAGNNTGTLTYIWKVDGIQKAAGNTYTVLLNDLGKNISLEVTSTDKQGTLYTSTAPVRRKVYSGPSPSTPVVSDKTLNSVTLVSTNGNEYSCGKVLWQTSSVFNGLLQGTAYTFYQRVAETQTTEASAASQGLSVTTYGSSAESLTGTATINNTDPRIGDILNGSLVDSNNTGALTYVWKADGAQVGTGSTYAVVPGDFGKTITLEITSSVETGVLTSTATRAVAKAVGPSAPSAPTLALKNHNSVTLTANAAYEYSKDGTIWQTNNVFSGLAPNTAYTFFQRVAETQTTEASAASQGFSVTTDGPAGSSNITVNVSTIDFGDVSVGAVSTAMRFTVSASNLTNLISYSLGGTNPEAFTVTEGLGYTDTSGGVIDVTYSPTTTGSHYATITFTGGDSPVTVSLVGAGVTDNSVTGIMLNTTSIALYSNATPNTQTLTATVLPSYAANQGVSWASINPATAVVDQNGTVTAVANGTTEIIVTSKEGGFTDSCTVTVTEYKSGGDTEESSEDSSAYITGRKAAKKVAATDITFKLGDIKQTKYYYAVWDGVKKISWKSLTKTEVYSVSTKIGHTVYLSTSKSLDGVFDELKLTQNGISAPKAPSVSVKSTSSGVLGTTNLTFAKPYSNYEYQLAQNADAIYKFNWISCPTDGEKPIAKEIDAQQDDLIFIRAAKNNYYPASQPTKGVKTLVSGAAPNVHVSFEQGVKGINVTISAESLKNLQYAVADKNSNENDFVKNKVKWKSIPSKGVISNVKIEDGQAVYVRTKATSKNGFSVAHETPYTKMI